MGIEIHGTLALSHSDISIQTPPAHQFSLCFVVGVRCEQSSKVVHIHQHVSISNSLYIIYINYVMLYCLSFPGEERKEGKSLSAWRKCCHSISALTLLTCRFLNMRSFWTADLNITVLCSASSLHIHKDFSST